MKKTIISLFIIACCFVVKAQVMTSNQGTPVLTKAYTEVNGSPYLTSTWINGDVALRNGKIYKNIPVKYDQYADMLIFKADNGDSLAFAQPVHEFKLMLPGKGGLTERYYRNGFPVVANNTADSFYEVISDGKTKLLKRTKKMIQSHKDYSSANQINDIYSTTAYYILKDDKMQLLKPGNKTLTAALADKSASVDKYIKDNNLDLRKDEDMAKLFSYYDSL